MKTSEIKSKVAAKVAKGKEKIEKKCGKAAKCAAWIVATAALAAIVGCSTADAPTAQRAQTVTAKDISIVFNISGTNAPAPSISIEIATAAQANETAGTETMTATNTQTPTNDVKTDLKFTYGLASDTASGTSWLQSLTDASLKGLSSWLKSGKANGTMTVTKTDGTTDTVTCKDGSCYDSDGDCINCHD